VPDAGSGAVVDDRQRQSEFWRSAFTPVCTGDRVLLPALRQHALTINTAGAVELFAVHVEDQIEGVVSERVPAVEYLRGRVVLFFHQYGVFVGSFDGLRAVVDQPVRGAPRLKPAVVGYLDAQNIGQTVTTPDNDREADAPRATVGRQAATSVTAIDAWAASCVSRTTNSGQTTAATTP
jgi:hypothetical protein